MSPYICPFRAGRRHGPPTMVWSNVASSQLLEHRVQVKKMGKYAQLDSRAWWMKESGRGHLGFRLEIFYAISLVRRRESVNERSCSV